MAKISIIIPIFNEEKYIGPLLKKINKIKLIENYKKEIICVNDGSTDDSLKILKKFKKIKIISQKNSGKGHAVQRGIKKAKGKYIIVQDSDLEYDPRDINKLLKKIISHKHTVVYGSRYLKYNIFLRLISKKQSVLAFFFNYILSINFYIKHRIYITDLLTGYKMYPRVFFEKNKIYSKGFEADHEITLKLLKNRYLIKEIPIKYYPRSKKEGKKINFRDALKALLLINTNKYI